MADIIKIPLIRVEIKLKVEGVDQLPRYLFSPLRGLLGASLRRISCVARRFDSCLPCPLNQHCAYGYLFETPQSCRAERMKLYPYLPHPFAISPPYPAPSASSFPLGLTLVGRAIQYFPHFILALENAGRQGIGKKRVPFKLFSIKDIISQKELYEGKKLRPPHMIDTIEASSAREVLFETQTPISLRYQGRIVQGREFAFHILVRNLLRRLSALSYFHAGQKLDLDFKGLIEKAHEIQMEEEDFQEVEIIRYSARTKKKMPLRGFTGRVIFKGELSPFVPLLKFGEFLHVGKNISFGFGAYRLKPRA